jgi:hypothetical protein
MPAHDLRNLPAEVTPACLSSQEKRVLGGLGRKLIN